MKIRRKRPRHRIQLGDAIRNRRRNLGMTQEDLAEYADISTNYVSLVELGEKSVSIDTLCRITRALKCSLAQLVVEADL